MAQYKHQGSVHFFKKKNGLKNALFSIGLVLFVLFIIGSAAG